MVLCGCSSVIHSEGFPDYDRFAQRGYAAEELAKKVGVGFGVNVVCPMIRDLEHGLRKIERVSIVNKHRGKFCELSRNVIYLANDMRGKGGVYHMECISIQKVLLQDTTKDVVKLGFSTMNDISKR